MMQHGRPKENQKSGDVAPGKEPASSPDTPEEVTKVPSATDRTRRIILENLGRMEKKTLRELVAKAGIKVANSSFDTIYYETNKTMQIARELGFVK